MDYFYRREPLIPLPSITHIYIYIYRLSPYIPRVYTLRWPLQSPYQPTLTESTDTGHLRFLAGLQGRRHPAHLAARFAARGTEPWLSSGEPLWTSCALDGKLPWKSQNRGLPYRPKMYLFCNAWCLGYFRGGAGRRTSNMVLTVMNLRRSSSRLGGCCAQGTTEPRSGGFQGCQRSCTTLADTKVFVDCAVRLGTEKPLSFGGISAYGLLRMGFRGRYVKEGQPLSGPGSLMESWGRYVVMSVLLKCSLPALHWNQPRGSSKEGFKGPGWGEPCFCDHSGSCQMNDLPSTQKEQEEQLASLKCGDGLCLLSPWCRFLPMLQLNGAP